MIISVPADSDFSIHNLPWGIFSVNGDAPRVGIAIGEHIVDTVPLAESGFFDFDTSVLYEDHLNPLIALGKEVTSRARTQVQGWLKEGNASVADADRVLVAQSEATMHLPVQIGDYTDFYSSIEHATNVGKMFRDPENALLPNWRHLPVGYHGRASSVVVSGTEIVRPRGQVKPNHYPTPRFEATSRLDFELEMGFIIGRDSTIGTPISTVAAEDYIFGAVIVNDWSARDIQKWEYVPLGPFLGKNFGTSISPWVVPLEALEPFRTPGPQQQPEVLDYLQQTRPANYDLDLTVAITPEGGSENIVSQSNTCYLYWSMAQQLAHHTVNGCNVRVGDLMASGTISGKDEASYGSMLEISHGGRQPITLNDGSERAFLRDGDTVTLRAAGVQHDLRVGFGQVSGKILPAKSIS